jgi:hypothetical protein
MFAFRQAISGEQAGIVPERDRAGAMEGSTAAHVMLVSRDQKAYEKKTKTFLPAEEP